MLAVVSDSRAEDSRWSQDNLPADRRKRDLLVRRHGGDWTARVRWASSQPPPRRATEKATELLAAWRTTVDPYGQGLFDRRLGRDGLSEGQALLVMGDDGDPSEPEPDWWSTYRSLVSVFDAEDAWVGTDEDWLERISAEIPAGTGSSVPFVHTSAIGVHTQSGDERQSVSRQSMLPSQSSSVPPEQSSMVHIEQDGADMQLATSLQSDSPSQSSSRPFVHTSVEGTQHAGRVEQLGSRQSTRPSQSSSRPLVQASAVGMQQPITAAQSLSPQSTKLSQSSSAPFRQPPDTPQLLEQQE